MPSFTQCFFSDYKFILFSVLISAIVTKYVVLSGLLKHPFNISDDKDNPTQPTYIITPFLVFLFCFVIMAGVRNFILYNLSSYLTYHLPIVMSAVFAGLNGMYGYFVTLFINDVYTCLSFDNYNNLLINVNRLFRRMFWSYSFPYYVTYSEGIEKTLSKIEDRNQGTKLELAAINVGWLKHSKQIKKFADMSWFEVSDFVISLMSDCAILVMVVAILFVGFRNDDSDKNKDDVIKNNETGDGYKSTPTTPTGDDNRTNWKVYLLKKYSQITNTVSLLLKLLVFTVFLYKLFECEFYSNFDNTVLKCCAYVYGVFINHTYLIFFILVFIFITAVVVYFILRKS